MATGSSIVYFFGGAKEARRSVVRFTRTALTVGIRTNGCGKARVIV